MGEKVEKLAPGFLFQTYRVNRAGFLEAAQARQLRVHEDVVGMRRDGSQFPMEVSLAPVRTEAEGDLVFAVCRDVTEQRDARAEADRLKRDFMATVSHELRTPLACLLGYGEMMEDLPDLPVEARHFLGVMMRSAHRELGVVSDLLTLAAIDSGELVMHRAYLDLRSVAYRGVRTG